MCCKYLPPTALGLCLTLLPLTPAWSAPASTPESTPSQGWQGSAELGAVITQGNSETENVLGKLKLTHEHGPWRELIELEALRSKDQDIVTSERYLLALNENYLMGRNHFLFASLRYEEDRFSGFEYRGSLTAGYGRDLLRGESLTLHLEAGPGIRHSRSDTGVYSEEEIIHAKGKLRWKIGPGASLEFDLLTEASEENTFTEAQTALITSINERLKAKLSYKYLHNSQVPVGVVDTDTTLAATLLFTIN